MDKGWPFPAQVPFFDPFAVANESNLAPTTKTSGITPTTESEMDEGEICEDNGDTHGSNQQVHSQNHNQIVVTDNTAEYDPTQPLTASCNVPVCLINTPFLVP